jgi:alpha-tubulin suppressor-like RCC1 family protein
MPVDTIYTTNVGSAGTRNAMNTFAIGTDGAVYGAGSNMYGQLGVYSSRPEYSATPKKMDVFGPSMPAKLVLSGMGTTVIYTEKGGVYTVGNNSNGQIGDGTTNNAYTPIRAKYTNDLRSVTY